VRNLLAKGNPSSSETVGNRGRRGGWDGFKKRRKRNTGFNAKVGEISNNGVEKREMGEKKEDQRGGLRQRTERRRNKDGNQDACPTGGFRATSPMSDGLRTRRTGERPRPEGRRRGELVWHPTTSRTPTSRVSIRRRTVKEWKGRGKGTRRKGGEGGGTGRGGGPFF